MKTAKRGDLETVRRLLEQGQAVGELDEDGYTAFQLAVRAGRVKMARLLAEYGAQVLRAVGSLSNGCDSPAMAHLFLERGVSADTLLDVAGRPRIDPRRCSSCSWNAELILSTSALSGASSSG